MKLVKLTSCWNQFEAEVIRGALENAGICCIVQSNNMSGIYIGGTGIANSAFEVPILVREEDLEKAQRVIAEE